MLRAWSFDIRSQKRLCTYATAKPICSRDTRGRPPPVHLGGALHPLAIYSYTHCTAQPAPGPVCTWSGRSYGRSGLALGCQVTAKLRYPLRTRLPAAAPSPFACYATIVGRLPTPRLPAVPSGSSACQPSHGQWGTFLQCCLYRVLPQLHLACTCRVAARRIRPRRGRHRGAAAACLPLRPRLPPILGVP